MSTQALPTTRRRIGLVTVVGRAFVIAAIGVILVLAVKFAQALGSVLSAERLQGHEMRAFVLVAAIYMVGHGLRILRLALLVGGTRIGLRTIGAFHLMTASAALITPLKLGEIYRVAELAHLVQSPIRALILVWWERVFDVTTILLLLVVALMVTPASQIPGFVVIAALSALFVAATASAAILLPGNLGRVSFFILRRYHTPRSIPVLRMLSALRSAIDEAPRMLRGKTSSLAMFSVLIWGCELAAFNLALRHMGSAWSGLEGFLAFLSSVTRGETDICEGFTMCAAVSGQLPYVVATHGVLAACGLAAGLYYAWRRFRSDAPHRLASNV